jgi:Fic family protein
MINLKSFVITPKMLSAIAKIDEFKGAWQFLQNLKPERLQALKKVATIESVGSSTRIEGSKLSDQEVEALLSNLSTKSFRSRDEQEVAGYAAVCEEVFSAYDHMPLTENIIKELHAFLLKYSDKDQRHLGEYKKFPNSVEAIDAQGKSLGIIFETTSPFKTRQEMEELLAWTREALETNALHPLLVIGIFIVTFLAIHPFQDGNGRISRVLTTLLLLKSGYSYVPYSSLESVIEDNKESYYIALRRTQKTMQGDRPDFGPWLIFFLRSLEKQKNVLEQKIVKERAMTMALLDLSKQLIELLNVHGQLSIGQMVALTQANRNTIKKHLQELVRIKQIVRMGKGRATFYALP